MTAPDLILSREPGRATERTGYDILPLPGEYIGRARHREELAEECSARGLYQEARRHWDVADLYRALADSEMQSPETAQ